MRRVQTNSSCQSPSVRAIRNRCNASRMRSWLAVRATVVEPLAIEVRAKDAKKLAPILAPYPHSAMRPLQRTQLRVLAQRLTIKHDKNRFE